jgi:hypothetical protein
MGPGADVGEVLERVDLWRRQCARNLMDCYGLGMQLLMESPRDKNLEALTRLMVDGMTSVKTVEDERSFYKMAAELCRVCGEAAAEKGGLFRIYGAIFADIAGEEG